MRNTEDLTRAHDKARLNVCLCYNSKNEILEAATSGASTVEEFEKKLYGGFNCKPDILIRTSNEIRLSNFLLYQTDGS